MGLCATSPMSAIISSAVARIHIHCQVCDLAKTIVRYPGRACGRGSKVDLVANWFESGNNTLIPGTPHEMAPVKFMAPIGCIREERLAVDGCPANVVVMQMAKHDVCDVSWRDAEASQLTWHQPARNNLS